MFSIADIEDGNTVYIKVSSLKRLGFRAKNEKCSPEQAIRFIAMVDDEFDQLHLLAPDIDILASEWAIDIGDIAAVYGKDGSKLYPTTLCTPGELTMLEGLKPFMKHNTKVIKVRCADTYPELEFIKLKNVQTACADEEHIDLPCFLKGEMFAGMDADKEYSLEDFNIEVVGDQCKSYEDLYKKGGVCHG